MQQAFRPTLLFSTLIALLLLAAGCDSARAVAPKPSPGATSPLSLPAPSALLHQLPARVGSSTEAEVARDGAQYEPLLLNQHVSAAGSTADFSPAWQKPAAMQFGNLACALYQFDLSTYDRDPTLRLDWAAQGLAGDAWIGLSDAAHDRWEWHPAPASGVLDLPNAADYAYGDGRALAAVVLTGTSVWILNSIRFGAEPAQPGGPHELWFYLQTNLQVQAKLDEAIALVNQAAALGYTKVVLADSKLDRIDSIGTIYTDKLVAFDNACKAAGVELVPSLCGIGWSDTLLYHDVNLIEGQQIKDCAFLVSGNTADALQDAALVNGGFEQHSGDSFNGWNQIDGAGLSTYADTSTTHGGAASIRYENFPGGANGSNDRVTQTIAVQPWHHYIYSFWLKTDGVSPGGSLWCHAFGTAPFKQLGFYDPPVAGTQDWTEYHIPFNSQDYTSVTVYMGIWGGVSGRFWIDDARIENAGLINLIRRGGAPFKVTSADGSVTYSEGTDYATAVDPAMGQAAGYPGTYDTWHARPLLQILPSGAINDGDTIKVNSYHAVQTDDGKVCCCLSEDGVYDIIQANFARLQQLIAPKTVLVQVDEMRVAGWCQKCRDSGKTPGGLLADCTARIDAVAQAAIPGVKLVVWNDMYDPDHNAVPSYYLCNGSMANALPDNPPASWDIGNWRFFTSGLGNPPDTTLDFFSGRGNRQILSGYYDRGDSSDIGPWLDAAKGTPGVYACMYTTWVGDYNELQNWALAVRAWEAANP